MSFPQACCKVPPVTSDYIPQGEMVDIGGLNVYETKNKTAKVMLICAYDIFGLHPNIKQFCDILNSTGEFQVVEPDFFQGECIPPGTPLIPDSMPKIFAFVGERGNWDKTTKNDLIKVMNHYEKTRGITAFGIFGFCWGGKIAIKAAAEIEKIKGAAVIHPAMVTLEDAEVAKIPMIFIPSKDEPDMMPLVDAVKKNLGEGNIEHYRFDDVPHGFAGARGDWKNDEVHKKRANETIQLCINFFKKHLIK